MHVSEAKKATYTDFLDNVSGFTAPISCPIARYRLESRDLRG